MLFYISSKVTYMTLIWMMQKSHSDCSNYLASMRQPKSSTSMIQGGPSYLFISPIFKGHEKVLAAKLNNMLDRLSSVKNEKRTIQIMARRRRAKLVSITPNSRSPHLLLYWSQEAAAVMVQFITGHCCLPRLSREWRPIIALSHLIFYGLQGSSKSNNST